MTTIQTHEQEVESPSRGEKDTIFGVCNTVNISGRPSMYLKTEVVLLEDLIAENETILKGETVEVTNQIP